MIIFLFPCPGASVLVGQGTNRIKYLETVGKVWHKIIKFSSACVCESVGSLFWAPASENMMSSSPIFLGPSFFWPLERYFMTFEASVCTQRRVREMEKQDL